jgi:hypothetical protein
LAELETALLADLSGHTAQAVKETERLTQRLKAIQRERYKWADQAMAGAVPSDIAR